MHSFWIFLICFEVWAKLAQLWLVCAGNISWINKELMLLVIIINCAIWPTERTVQCQIRSSLGQWCAYQKHWHCGMVSELYSSIIYLLYSLPVVLDLSFLVVDSQSVPPYLVYLVQPLKTFSYQMQHWNKRDERFTMNQLW